VSNNLPTEGGRIIAARDRLYDVLGASSAAEGEVIRYLTRALPIEAAELLAAMAEREVKRARAAGYDKGHFEGMEQLAEAQAAAAERATSGDAIVSLLDADTDGGEDR